MRDFTRRMALSLPLAGAMLAKLGGEVQAQAADTEWRYYGGDISSTRYVPLDQVNASNFNNLEVAWRFKPDMMGARPEFVFESTPLVIKGKLYTTCGSRRDVAALDAATGEILWLFRKDEGERGRNAPRQYSGHGVSYWTDGKEERILYVTPGYQLIALDARTGIPVKSFGTDGVVDLKQNDDQTIDLITGEIGLHSTPLVVKNTVVVGAAHLTGGAPPHRKNVKGYVRGFDARTGKRKWIFHTIPRKGEFGYESWVKPGQAEEAGNNGVWAQMSADPDLGLVYLPVELATGDYNGQYRHGAALFGESIVAVDAETGKRRWHYQLVHHGLWDMDIPCAPILADIPVDGKTVKALIQPSKQCWLYVLNRETGEPVFPIEEKPVPAGDVPEEWYSPTQPHPSKPPAYDIQGVTHDDLINFTPELRAEAIKLVDSQFVIGPMFTPPSMAVAGGKRGTLHTPGSNGGTDWAGGSYDPDTHMVYVYSQRTLAILGIVKNPNLDVSDFEYVQGQPGQATRVTRALGAPAAGSAAPAAARPAPAAAAAPSVPPVSNTVQGLPLLKPPYGTLSGLDVSKGTLVWQVAHGETPDNIKNHPALKGLNIPRTGQVGMVGPTCTKTLVICGDSGFSTGPDGRRGAMLRAYDKATGEEKGAVYIPAGTAGAPMTYMLGGRQYIVVACGGGNVTEEMIAFRLPRA